MGSSAIVKESCDLILDFNDMPECGSIAQDGVLDRWALANKLSIDGMHRTSAPIMLYTKRFPTSWARWERTSREPVVQPRPARQAGNDRALPDLLSSSLRAHRRLQMAVDTEAVAAALGSNSAVAAMEIPERTGSTVSEVGVVHSWCKSRRWRGCAPLEASSVVTTCGFTLV